MKTRPIIVLIAIFVFGAALAASASTGSISLDFQVIRDTPESVHQLYSGPMPVVGETCEVTASSAGNNTSVHPGNDLKLTTGGHTIVFADMERAPNVSTPGSATIVPGESGIVTLTLGPDGVYSADMSLEFECTQSTTTTTETTSTTTTTPSSTTSVTSSPSTTTTSTSLATTTTAPTTTTECVDTSERKCDLPFTGPVSLWPLAMSLVTAGGLTVLAGRAIRG